MARSEGREMSRAEPRSLLTLASLTFKIDIVREYSKHHNVKRASFSEWPDAEAASGGVESGRGGAVEEAGAEARQAQRSELHPDFDLLAHRVAESGPGEAL